MTATYLTFRLAEELYAVKLDTVSEISAYPERIARVPTAPSWVRGLFSLRGSVIPALDLCNKLGFVTSQPSARTCVLITHIQIETLRLVVGMIVDKVEDLVQLTDAEIEPAPPFGTTLRVACLLGTARRDDTIICVLDLPSMFKQEELLSAALVEERERLATAEVERERRQLESEAGEPIHAMGTPATSQPMLGREDPGLPGLFLFEDA